MLNKLEESLSFSLQIEELVEEKDISYIDAIVLHCAETGTEIEVVSQLITGALKAKIKLEAEALHFIKRSNTKKLPL